MEKSKRQFEGKGTLRGRILDKIGKNNSANLSELVGLGNSRQSILYHIKHLYNENKIRAFIKGAGLKDEELYFSIAPGEYPQEIQKIKKIIDEMCNGESGTAAMAYETFVNVCGEKEVPRVDTIKLAYDLISGLQPRLKEAVVFGLTYDMNKEIPNPTAGFNIGPGTMFAESDTIRPPTYFENGECYPPLKNYAYFIRLLNDSDYVSSLPAL